MEARSSAPGCFLSFDGTNESASSTRLKRLRKWVVIEDLLNRQICKGHSGSSPGHLAKGVVGRTEKKRPRTWDSRRCCNSPGPPAPQMVKQCSDRISTRVRRRSATAAGKTPPAVDYGCLLEVGLPPSPPATRPSRLVSPRGGLVARQISRHRNRRPEVPPVSRFP